jgi:hypothetical protein
MANDFFDSADYTALSRNTRALAEAVNAIATAIEAGFDLFPSKLSLQQGKAHFVATDTGVANAYVIAMEKTIPAYSDGLHFCFRAANTNTGASTINIDGKGLKDIRNYAGTALTGGEILQGALTTGWYDNTNGYCRILSPLTAVASVTGIDINALTALAAPDDADKAPVYDASAAASRAVTLQNLLIVGWSAMAAAVDPSADYVLIYDASANALKKTLISTIADEGQLALVADLFS